MLQIEPWNWKESGDSRQGDLSAAVEKGVIMQGLWAKRREESVPYKDDPREPEDIDYARIIHSASFRRLQGKTQILNLGDSDFYRTRLTHSLEVAQIAGGIVQHLEKDDSKLFCLPSRSLIQAIGCAHDLGHPPFGHGGEIALNYCMRNHGGFEGNGQTLRILSRLENFSGNNGANLTRRTLMGVLKYPVSYKEAKSDVLQPALSEMTTTILVIDRKKSVPPKCYLDSEKDIVAWMLEPLSDNERREFQKCALEEGGHSKTRYKSFDCSVMDIADDIAYGVHDLEDAIFLGLVKKAKFRQKASMDVCRDFLKAQADIYTEESKEKNYANFVQDLFGDDWSRKRIVGRLVHYFIISVKIDENDIFREPLLRFKAELGLKQRVLLDALKELVFEDVIANPSVQHLEFKGQMLVVAVFEAILSDPKKLLPRDDWERFQKADQDPRIICDYVAGMTDSYLLRTYDRLFSPHMGSVFDKL